MTDTVNVGPRQIVVLIEWWDGASAELAPPMPARVSYDDGVLVVQSPAGQDFYPLVHVRTWQVTTRDPDGTAPGRP
jgi:hypothetical protein